MNLPESRAVNRTAIIFMLLAMAGFIFNDMMAKLASDDLETGQIILLRGLIASPVMVLIAWWRGAFRQIGRLTHKSVLWRTTGEVVATAFYLTALFNMPIANATAILQTVPLASAAGAALLFGERVGIRRWSAIGIGFAGVLLIVRPGSDGFTIWSLFALGAVGAILVRDLSSRILPEDTPVLGVTALSAVMVTILGAVMSLFGEWRPVSPQALFYLTGSALFLMGAYNFILLAMRYGDVSAVAPFRYTILLWAILIQIVVFGIWPDWMTLAGSAVLVAMGLYTIYRERIVDANQDKVADIGRLPFR